MDIQRCQFAVRDNEIAVGYHKTIEPKIRVWCTFTPFQHSGGGTVPRANPFLEGSGDKVKLSDIDPNTVTQEIFDGTGGRELSPKTFTSVVYPIWRAQGFSLPTCKGGKMGRRIDARTRLQQRYNLTPTSSESRTGGELPKRRMTRQAVTHLKERYNNLDKTFEPRHYEKLQSIPVVQGVKDLEISARLLQKFRTLARDVGCSPIEVVQHCLCMITEGGDEDAGLTDDGSDWGSSSRSSYSD